MINLEKSLEAKALPLIKGTADMFIVGYIFRKKNFWFSPCTLLLLGLLILSRAGGGVQKSLFAQISVNYSHYVCAFSLLFWAPETVIVYT